MKKTIQTFFILVGILIATTNYVKIYAAPHTEQPNQLISLDLQNINIRDLLHLFSDFTIKNIIISDKVNGKTSIKLKNIPWHDALDIILKTQRLSKQEEKNVIFIAPSSDMDKYEKPSFSSPSVLIPLQNTSAEEVANILSKQNTLLNNSNLSVDKNANQLLLNAAPTQISAIQKTVNSLDLPAKQVLIEGRIVSADDKVANELGLKFSTAYANDNSSANSGGMNMDLPFAVNNPGHFGLAIAKLGEGVILNMELAALESAGHVKIISSPKLITGNNQTAYIESGEEIPYQEKTSSGATNVEFKKAVLSLKTTPAIISPERLTLNLQINQDKISEITVNGVPAIQTQQIQTQVTLNTGETIVLGGIYEYSTIANEVSIPGLRAIPLFGALFRNKQNTITRKELLIFVTPHIIN